MNNFYVRVYKDQIEIPRHAKKGENLLIIPQYLASSWLSSPLNPFPVLKF